LKSLLKRANENKDKIKENIKFIMLFIHVFTKKGFKKRIKNKKAIANMMLKAKK